MNLIRFMLEPGGNSNFPEFIFLNKSLSSVPLNGNKPVVILNRSIPKAQTSAGKPYYYLLTISGAMYEGVPQNTLSFVDGSIAIENLYIIIDYPKSISFIY